MKTLENPAMARVSPSLNGSDYNITMPINWTPERIALLGTMSDSEVAKRLGCERNVVAGKRYQLGIPSIPLNLWTDDENNKTPLSSSLVVRVPWRALLHLINELLRANMI